MSKRITYKPHGETTRIYSVVKIEDIPQYLKEKYDGYRVSEQTLEFCMKVASGEDAISAVMNVYNLKENKLETRRTAKELMGKPKVVDMINIIRENYKSQAIIDTNGILMRLEMIYADCIQDNDRNNALRVLKQMTEVIKGMDGSVSINDVKIVFELPNAVKAKQIDIEATDIEEEI